MAIPQELLTAPAQVPPNQTAGQPIRPVESGSQGLSSIQVRLLVLPQLQQIVARLRVITGDSSQCGDPCLLTLGYSNTFQILRNSCIQTGPAHLQLSFGNDPTVAGLLSSYVDACDRIEQTARTSGPSAETPVWKSAALDLISRLDPVVKLEQARQVSYPPAPK